MCVFVSTLSTVIWVVDWEENSSVIPYLNRMMYSMCLWPEVHFSISSTQDGLYPTVKHLRAPAESREAKRNHKRSCCIGLSWTRTWIEITYQTQFLTHVGWCGREDNETKLHASGPPFNLKTIVLSWPLFKDLRRHSCPVGAPDVFSLSFINPGIGKENFRH